MSVDEMEEFLERLGIEVISGRGDELLAHCPHHYEGTKEDKNPSWWINADTGRHICFSCKFQGGLYTLVGVLQGVDQSEIKTWISSNERDLTKAFNKLIAPKPTPVEAYNPVTESMLSAFVIPPDDALISRGINQVAAEYYEILWDKTNLNWITVIRDPYTDRLLGWQEKGYGRRYFNNYPAGVNKSSTLFGYNKYTDGDMIVVESPLDVARLGSLKIFGGVSTYGSMVSMAQIHLIRAADRVIFAMDNDEAGRVASEKLLSLSKEIGFDAWFFNYSETTQKDIGAMSKNEIVFGLTNARHRIYGRRSFL